MNFLELENALIEIIINAHEHAVNDNEGHHYKWVCIENETKEMLQGLQNNKNDPLWLRSKLDNILIHNSIVGYIYDLSHKQKEGDIFVLFVNAIDMLREAIEALSYEEAEE